MSGSNEILKYVKDENLRTLLETGNFVYIILSKYPYYVKKKILESNELLKQWFKELVEERYEYLCELINNDPFLIYQLAYLYYVFFKKIPEELLTHLEPDDLLFNAIDIEKELCKKYLTKYLGSFFNYPYLKEDEVEVSEGRLKMLIPLIKYKSPSFYFEGEIYFWYNVWEKFGSEYCIKVWKKAIEKTCWNTYIGLILDCVLEDEELTRYFNPFFIKAHIFSIGHYYYIEAVPLFTATKKKNIELLSKLFVKLLAKKVNGYDEEVVNEAIEVVEASRRGIYNYPKYYEKRKKGFGTYEPIYYDALQHIMPDNWTKFTIYGVVPEYLKKYPPIIEKMKVQRIIYPKHL